MPEATRRVLNKLMTTAVAVQLNWTGKGQKIGLSTFELKNVIFGEIFFMIDACHVNTRTHSRAHTHTVLG